MTPSPHTPADTSEELRELLAHAKSAIDAMTPTEKAIMFLRQKVSYVASEMTMDLNDNVVRTRAESDAIVAKSDPALILAELDRRQAIIDELSRARSTTGAETAWIIRLRELADAMLEAKTDRHCTGKIFVELSDVELLKNVASHLEVTTPREKP